MGPQPYETTAASGSGDGETLAYGTVRHGGKHGQGGPIVLVKSGGAFDF